MAAGGGGDAEPHGALLLGCPQGAGPSPGDLLQRQPQRLGVGELPVEQVQRGLQRRQLLVGELDRGQVEALRAQRVALLLGRRVRGPIDGELDPQRFELGAIRVEAARKRVLVHCAVALHIAPYLQSRDRPALGHQVGDQRELADQLLCVLRHPRSKIEPDGETVLAPARLSLAICGDSELIGGVMSVSHLELSAPAGEAHKVPATRPPALRTRSWR